MIRRIGNDTDKEDTENMRKEKGRSEWEEREEMRKTTHVIFLNVLKVYVLTRILEIQGTIECT